MTDENSITVDNPDRPRSPLAFFIRPIVLIPLTIFVIVASIPIVYRSTRFSDIPPIDEIVDRNVDGRFIVDDDENAFTYYQSAVSLLPPVPGETDLSLGHTAIQNGRGWESIPPDVRAYLKSAEGAMAEWRLGTELDEAVYVDVATADFGYLIPVTQELRQFARLAVLRALRDLDEGRPNEAWPWLRALLRSSRHSGKHGFIIERLVGVAMHRMAAETIVVWATHERVSVEDLRNALAEVRKMHDLTAPNSAALKAEYIVGTNTISSTGSLYDLLGYTPVPKGLMGGYLFVNGEPQLSHVLYRHVFANYLSQCDLPPYDRTSAGTPLDLFLPTGKESPPLMNPARLSNVVMSRSVLARELVPAVSSCVTAFDLEHARQDALELCLHIELYRRKHGAYPATLEALVPEFLPEVPRDWMGTVPADRMLLIRRDFRSQAEAEGKLLGDQVLPAEGLILYSRGRDPGDDGGLIEENQDVGLRIPFPGARPATRADDE